MASVSNLDQDMKRLRMSRYTPKAMDEVRLWIEETLKEPLPKGDLLDVLKDGTVLCRLANLALPPPGIKYKKTAMPFMQMENISHFLRACEGPPYSLPAHDRFLTVDLYEAKDPAQVIQCLSSFSRVANSIAPHRFPTSIGPKRGGGMSPTHTGASNGSNTSGYGGRDRGLSTASSNATSPSARPLSQAYTGGSSILYAGYMGGASQGNQGIAFGARRQITTPAPHVPSLAEKQRLRREKDREAELLRQQREDDERKARREAEETELQARQQEEQRWEEEARRLREEEKRRVEQQKREWEEQERKWKEEEEARLREESEAQGKLEKESQRKRGLSDLRLKGQYLSQYQAEQKTKSRQSSYSDPERMAERQRIQELEDQLARAKERERQYEEERVRHGDKGPESKTRARSRSRPRPMPRPPSPDESNVSWVGDEREYMRQQHQQLKEDSGSTPPRTTPSSRPLPDPTANPALPARPLPDPKPASASASAMATPKSQASPYMRPLPDPQKYTSHPQQMNRTERFLASNAAPVEARPASHHPSEMGLTSEVERRAEDARRLASQNKTKASGWASKSLLEREMERERERQREWEEAQKQASNTPRDANAGNGPGKSWDVNQYGYTGGDSQNKPSTGIGFGAKRQIIGPRPPP
jgi:hypothetical protein